MLLLIIGSLAGLVISVPFYTLLERKLLSYRQNRKGPNKVRFVGLLQPILDALKLLTKEQAHTKSSRYVGYWLSPFGLLIITIMCWCCITKVYSFTSINWCVLIILVIICVGVYFSLLVG